MSEKIINKFKISNFTAIRIALALFIIHIITIKIFNYDEILKTTINNSFQTFECLVASVFLFLASRAYENISQKQSKTWLIFSLAALSYAFGNFMLSIFFQLNQKVPFPSYADVCFLLFYVFFIWGIFNFPMVPLRKEEKVKLILDLAIVLITSILIFSIVFFDILIDLSENNPTIFPNLFKIITAFAFPVLDIILIWSFLYFLYRRKATNRKWVLGMLLAGVISLAISDYMTNYELIKNSI